MRLPPPGTFGGSVATEDFTSNNGAIPSPSMSLTGPISGAQIRAARILLGWSQAELSCRCGVSESSIAKIEGGWLGARNSTRGKIALALIGSGINFIELGGRKALAQYADREVGLPSAGTPKSQVPLGEGKFVTPRVSILSDIYANARICGLIADMGMGIEHGRKRWHPTSRNIEPELQDANSRPRAHLIRPSGTGKCAWHGRILCSQRPKQNGQTRNLPK